MPVADVAASFREAVVDVLHRQGDRGLRRPRACPGCCSAAASSRTPGCARSPRSARAAAGIALRIPPLDLCTDNGAMIAALGAQLIMAGHEPSGPDFGADSTLPVTEIQVR